MTPVSQRIERLIVRRLDGEITADERLELDAELTRSPEARALLESYRAIDVLAAEVLAECAARPAPQPAVRFMPEPRRLVAARSRRWMFAVSALAACIALVLIWQAPSAPQRAPTNDLQVADRSEGPGIRTIPQPVVPVGAPGQGGVWRVNNPPGQRLDRVTDRNLILVPDQDGNLYLINVDLVREVQQSKQEPGLLLTRNPI